MNSSSIRVDISKFGISKTHNSRYVDIIFPAVLKYRSLWRYLWVYQILLSAFSILAIIMPILIHFFYKYNYFAIGIFVLLITFYFVAMITDSAISNFFVERFEGGEVIYIDERGFIDRRVSDELIIWECVEEIKLLKRQPFGVVALKVKLRKELSGRKSFRLERLVELLVPFRAKSLVIGVQHLELKSYVVSELFLSMFARFRGAADIQSSEVI